MKRYELPPPPPSKISELSAWQDAVENSMAQLEHQAVRAMNLELMLDYGCDTWKVYLDILTSMLAKAQKQLEAIKKEIQDVNWQRKDRQTEAGEKLRALETQWVMLVSKNYEIEQACVRLEEEIAEFKQQEQTNDENQPSDEQSPSDDNDGRLDDNEQQEAPDTNGFENGYEHTNDTSHANAMETDE